MYAYVSVVRSWEEEEEVRGPGTRERERYVRERESEGLGWLFIGRGGQCRGFQR